MDIILDAVLKKPDINKAKKILCVQPHPDDNEVGMGGVIAALSQKGCEVHYLTITDGSLGLHDAKMSHEKLVELRKAEAETSGRMLGCTHFHYLDKKDGTLCNIPELAGEVGEIIRDVKPDFVTAPDPWLMYEAHEDHIVTGRAVAQSVIATSLIEYPRGTKKAPHSVKGVAFYNTSSPNTVVDITSNFALQMKAIAAHKTQFDAKTIAMYNIYFKALAKKTAKNCPFKLGCGLKVLGEIHLHCFTGAQDI